MKVYNAKPGSPAKIDITVKKNDSFEYEIVGFNKDGSPYDFTGHSFILQVKEYGSINTDPAIISMSGADFTITQNQAGIDAGVNNVVNISKLPEDMNVEAKCYIYDLEMTDASSNVQTIQEGDFEVTQDVSE